MNEDVIKDVTKFMDKYVTETDRNKDAEDKNEDLSEYTIEGLIKDE